MARKAKKGGGGRLGRSETVTIRLDPKLNYLAEIAARAQRRTKSSLVEAALAEALFIVKVDAANVPNPRTVAQLGETLWHVDEWERLCRLVAQAPHLMTFEEQKIWAVIVKNANFWFGHWTELDATSEYYSYEPTPQNLLTFIVERHWQLIKKIAAGEAKPELLPSPSVIRVKPGTHQTVGALTRGALQHNSD